MYVYCIGFERVKYLNAMQIPRWLWKWNESFYIFAKTHFWSERCLKYWENFGYMYLTDEIMIEAKILNYANPVGVAVVSLTNKSTGKIIAQGRHTMYYWSKL